MAIPRAQCVPHDNSTNKNYYGEIMACRKVTAGDVFLFIAQIKTA